ARLRARPQLRDPNPRRVRRATREGPVLARLLERREQLLLRRSRRVQGALGAALVVERAAQRGGALARDGRREQQVVGVHGADGIGGALGLALVVADALELLEQAADARYERGVDRL